MRYERIDTALFKHNRNRFTKHMAEGCAAIFNSNDVMPTNADGHMPFKQNSDLFHLSGIDQEESTLIIFPDAPNAAHQEVLFLRETNDTIAIWEGEKLSKEQARDISGIQTVYWSHEFDTVLPTILADCHGVYLNSNEHLRSHNKVETADERFTKWFKNKFPLHHLHRAAPIMHRIRSLKHTEEIRLMQRACDITKTGFMHVLNFVKPGVMEYEIEAEIIREFTRNRANGFAYTPIIASGKSSCVLHYIENNKECRDGDILLMDFGAEYANYDSDLTRCIPVNGRFTARQKQVYQAVLNVKNEAQKILRPGVFLAEYQKEVGKIMESELLRIGLLSSTDIKNQNPQQPAYKKYFMHGTSHFLGLDTHDVGSWSEPISADMVFTCEPGIYIREEGLGIRLEDDIWIREESNVNLMGHIPIEIEEIEQLMNA